MTMIGQHRFGAFSNVRTGSQTQQVDQAEALLGQPLTVQRMYGTFGLPYPSQMDKDCWASSPAGHRWPYRSIQCWRSGPESYTWFDVVTNNNISSTGKPLGPKTPWQLIDAYADAYKAWGKDFYLNFSHEPYNDVSGNWRDSAKKQIPATPLQYGQAFYVFFDRFVRRLAGDAAHTMAWSDAVALGGRHGVNIPGFQGIVHNLASNLYVKPSLGGYTNWMPHDAAGALALDHVDIISVDSYNMRTSHNTNYPQYGEPKTVGSAPMGIVECANYAAANGKLFAIGEMGTPDLPDIMPAYTIKPGDKAAWFTNALAYIKANQPHLEFISYSDIIGSNAKEHYAFDSTPETLIGVKAMLADTFWSKG